MGLEHLHDLPDHQRLAARGHLLLLQPVPIHTLAQQSQVTWKEKVMAPPPQLLSGSCGSKQPHSTKVSLSILSLWDTPHLVCLTVLPFRRKIGGGHPSLGGKGKKGVNTYRNGVCMGSSPGSLPQPDVSLPLSPSTWMLPRDLWHHVCNQGAFAS